MTSFHNNPEKFQKTLSSHCGELEQLYDALSKDDSSEAVIAALSILKKTRTMPNIPKSFKCDDLSYPCRQTGNALFRCGDYNSALQMYNLAIGSAPKKSQSIIFAYSNRSALFQKVKVYSAALKDIETCLSLRCPPQIEAKLKLRREECLRMVADEKSKIDLHKSFIAKEFFKFSVGRHPQIPSASTYVEVITENGTNKFVAAKEIPVGSVVAVETAFASNLDTNNYYYACHYCHKFVFNLIPCDNCCETFFCSNECKNACLTDYHNVECQLIDVIKDVFPEDCFRIPLKAALKMKSKIKHWEELISIVSKSFDETTDKSMSELYDEKNVQSVLHIRNINTHFVYGQKFNQSFVTATIIHHLDKVPGFFPISGDLKQQAIRTFSRIIMHLIPLHQQYVMIQNSAMCYPNMEIKSEPEANSGLFSFTGNLEHACEPNLLVLGLQKKVALVAVQTIAKGTELTISYAGHWFDRNYSNLRPAKLMFIKPGCHCRVCTGKWSQDSVKDGNNRANDKQKNFFTDWFMLRVVTQTNQNAATRVFNETCKGLDMWKDKPNTKQYLELYSHFQMIMCRCQYLTTDNGFVNA